MSAFSLEGRLVFWTALAAMALGGACPPRAEGAGFLFADGARLSRAEMIERFKAPILSPADGFVKVFATCSVDIRREYQAPVARFAGETVTALARAAKAPRTRFESPSVIIHLGDVRTNRTDVVVRVATNDAQVVTRLYLPSPAHADLSRLRLELVRAYCRAREGLELTDAEAEERWRMTDPDYRLAQDLRRLQDWLEKGAGDGDEGLRLLYRVFRPGTLSRIEARVFASRLWLYPPSFDEPFAGRFDSLSFADAIRYAKDDPAIRRAARLKADEMPVFGGGRGDKLKTAAMIYRAFLLALADEKTSPEDLETLLEVADMAFNLAYEEAK